MSWVSQLRHRLLILILLVLLPAAIIIAFDVIEVRTRQVKAAELQGRQLAQSITGTLDRAISHVEGTLDLLAQLPEVRNLSTAACSTLLTQVAQAQPRYANIIATNPQGDAVCASNPKAVGVSAADRPWFQQVLATRSFTIGDYAIGRVSHRPILGFGAPLYNAGNEFTGVVYASLDLGWFGAHDIAEGLPANATFTLIDQNGVVMVRYPDDGNWASKSIADTSLFAALKATANTTDIAVADLDGSSTFFHLVKSQRSPGAAPIYLAVGLDLGPELASINHNIAIKVALLLAAAAAITAFSFLTSTRMISRPVQTLVDLSSRIAGGDFSVRSGLAHDSSEFGHLAKSLDSMAGELERHQAELEEQQDYMRAVLDNMSEMVFCFDTDGRVVFMNGAARALGLPEDALTYRELISATDALLDRNLVPLPFEQIPIVRVMNGETVVNAEINVRINKDGSILTHLLNGQKIVDEHGRRVGAVLAVRDITTLRATEATLRQSQKLEAIGQLTGGIAHDFNNLLGVIIGSIDTLMPHLSKPDDIDLANEALNGALRGAALTRQMLAFARRQALNPGILNLGEHLPQIATMMRRTLGENIVVTTHYSPDLWACLVDAGQLDNVLLNFAINARDAMPEGGHLTIEVGNAVLDAHYADSNAEVASGEYVRIAVTDDGIGIPPELLGRIMEPFFTTKEPGKGTGLGLSMAFGFAKQSGGHLKVYSEPGHGTTVNLYLPRAMSPGRAATIDSIERPAPKGAERVLLVDDNEAVRKTAARLLTDLGYQVTEAASGPEALQILARESGIDVLFSDVVMPGGISGFDLASQAEQLYPRLKVLLVTGFAEAAVRTSVAKARNVALMSKPYRRHELAERLRALLDNS
ncbi:ATP-binding protein [Dongia rigui]|uniref:histidine kinase n=1 Tax=Dongia rigui TaxID=940149 RepID=A0ABU5DVC0_9PROT|nr:ATP-binding protein [Dongia rigui]MDY0871251.1 ATP-binding protein [Dongia rigui]